MTAASGNLPQDAILIARTMGPAELLDYDRQRVRALVLEEGGTTSHVAIVARALGLVAITQAKGVLDSVEPGDPAILDAEGGELHLRPTPEVVAAYSDKVRFRARRQAQYAALRTVPPVTLDGAARVAQYQCGLRLRSAASRSVRRRRHRPVPHRAAIHDRVDLSAARAADAHL